MKHWQAIGGGWWQTTGPLAWPILLAAVILIAAFLKGHRTASGPVHGYDPKTGNVNLRLFSVPVPPQALSGWSRWRRDLILEFRRKNPKIDFISASKLQLPGELAGTTDVMSFIGDTWPDVFVNQEVNFAPYIRNGFCMPLDELAKEAGYNLADYTPPGARELVVQDGRQYGLIAEAWPYGLTYRRDLFEKFGLGRDFEIRTWEDLYLAAMVCTRDEVDEDGIVQHIRGIGLFDFGVNKWGNRQFFSFLVSDGGNAMTRDSKGEWHVEFDSPAGIAAAKFIRRLQHGRWVRSPKYGWPVLLRLKNGEQPCTDEETKSVDGAELEAVVPDGREEKWIFNYAEAQEGGKIQKGVALNSKGWEGGTFDVGKTAIDLMMPWFDLQIVGRSGKLNLPPSSLGVAPMPRGPDYQGSPRAYCEYQIISVCSLIQDRREALAAFKWAAWLAGPENRALRTAAYVQTGDFFSVEPSDLRAAGYGSYLKEFPPGWVEGLDAVKQSAFAIPAHPKYRQIAESDWELVFSRVLRDPNGDPKVLLTECGQRVREQVLGEISGHRLETYRTWCWIFVVIMATLFGVVSFFFVRRMFRGHPAKSINMTLGMPQTGLPIGVPQTGIRYQIMAPFFAVVSLFSARKIFVRAPAQSKGIPTATPPSTVRHRPWVGYLLVLPAVLLVALWNYVPLLWGMPMAFMKYSVLGGLQHSVWVGVDNFIHVLTDPFFPKYVLNTLLFVGLTLGMTFFAPIILALMLSEIPRGKVFFRMVYYLPTVTTGVVVALMWTEFFRGSPDGVLNRLSALFGINPIDWLGTPILAMACIIVPGVWAGMGPGCLIYLAALKSIPDDLYEAAELDGASLWQKIRLVTLPTIMPLIVINFLGSLLSTFHSSGNILLMTGGGPEGTTRVFSFMIWFKAFLELEYGQATAMAWVLGSALLGLMVVQLRLLSRVEFRRSTAE